MGQGTGRCRVHGTRSGSGAQQRERYKRRTWAQARAKTNDYTEAYRAKQGCEEETEEGGVDECAVASTGHSGMKPGYNGMKIHRAGGV